MSARSCVAAPEPAALSFDFFDRLRLKCGANPRTKVLLLDSIGFGLTKSPPDAKADPLSVDARREAIVAAVRQRGFATIEALAATFGVTVQTIRRDLNELSAEGRLER